MDASSIQIAMLFETSLESAVGMRSQLIFIVLWADKRWPVNIIYYLSNCCRRSSQNAMIADSHTIGEASGTPYIAGNVSVKPMGRNADLEANVYSRSLVNVVAKNRNTVECQLQIDILLLMEAYTRGERERAGRIPGFIKTVDALTKAILSQVAGV